MIFGVIVEMGVGLFCAAIGLMIWLKRKVTLLHDYHYQNVKEEDIPAYTRMIGIGIVFVGAGICITGLVNLFELPFWWVPLAAGFIVGIIIMNKAQKKYNGSWFS